MGFLDRLHDAATGLGGAVQAPFGLVWDLSRAPFVDDDIDGILGTINATVTSRTAQLGGNLFGPEEGLGSIVGVIPGREHLRGPVHGVLGGLETAYREGVAEPLSTAFTAGALANSPTYQGERGYGRGIVDQFALLADPRTWQDADAIAEHRGPGEAAVTMFATKDVLDEEEVERLQGTDAYQFASGTLDALARLFLSPDQVALRVGGAYRTSRLTAARGADLGRITAQLPRQVGPRAETFGVMRDAGRLAAINNAIDRAYLRLPEPVQRLVASERDFTPRDIGRLARFEETQRELGLTPRQLRTAGLERQIAESSDPERIRVLSNVVQSRKAREARIGAGATTDSPFQRQLAAQRQADIDAYFAAASQPQRRGFFSGITATPGWKRVDGFIDSLPTDVDTRAGLIRDRLFPTHHRGDILSRYLAEAHGPAEREAVMRVGLGDMRALEALERSDYALAKRLGDLMFEQATVRAEPVLKPLPVAPDGQLGLLDNIPDPLFDDYRNSQDRLSRIGEEIDAVVAEADRAERLRHVWSSVPAGPTFTRREAARHLLKSTSLYQTSPLGRAVRLITDMRPHHLVDSGDLKADAQLGRMMREAGYGDDEIARARGQFMALPTESRGASFERWVERTERKILEEHGLDQDEIRQVLAHAHLGRNQARSFIRGSKFDGEGRARLQFHDGDEIVDMELPLTVTQLQNVVPVPNFALLRKHTARYARLKYGDDWRGAITRGARPTWEAKEYGLDAMRGIMEVWRPTVLLRPAWTIRVVGDEQLRQLAKFGALSVMLDARQGIHNYGVALKKNPLIGWALKTDPVAHKVTAGGFVSAAGGMAVGGPLGAVAAGSLGNRIVRKMAEAEEIGFGNIRFGGHSLSGPFGDAGTTAEWYKAHASAANAVDELFGRHENRWLAGLRRNPASFRTHIWGESEQANAVYRAEWTKNLFHQIRQDRMGRQFLAGKTPDEVLDWLDNTLEGRQYAALVPWRTDHAAWVDAVAGQVDAYTGGLDEVKLGVLGLPDDASDARVSRLLDLIPERSRAPIHGAETEQLLAKSKLSLAINALINNAFDALGTQATDALSRNPTFARFYQAEARRLFGTLKPGQVPETLVRKLEGQARDFALRETRELLYDLAEQSRFGSMTRLLMPFYNAWQEVITRWAGLAVENPVFAARAKEVWQAPGRAGWTYKDDHGNEFIRLRIPEFARGLVNQGIFHSALDSQGYIDLDKNGFNLAAQGTPGFGPFVQIAVSDVVEKQPSLEDSLKFVIPFGPVDPLEALLPPTVKRAIAASGDEENAARANAEARILTTKLAQMQNGEIPQVDFSDPAARQRFLDQVGDEAGQLMKLRLFTGYVSPVAPLFESPYQPYIDVYRALRDGDWERAREVGRQYDLPGAGSLPRSAPPAADRVTTADDIFIDAFGTEFFALTQSFTQTVNGVPPTIEGMEASRQYGDLISAYPEWGGVIAGYDGGGTAVKFSRAVYDRQMATGQRRRLSMDEVLDGPDKRLGWANYSRYMDLVEMVRVKRGLPNLQVKAAEDLRQIKRVVIAGLAAKYPAWFADYSQTDRNAWNKRIEGARALVAEPTLKGRPDMQGLAEYLKARDAVMAVLATRDSTSLTAASNADVRFVWDTLVSAIAERNPAFADLLYRKLEHDPLADAAPSLGPPQREVNLGLPGSDLTSSRRSPGRRPRPGWRGRGRRARRDQDGASSMYRRPSTAHSSLSRVV